MMFELLIIGIALFAWNFLKVLISNYSGHSSGSNQPFYSNDNQRPFWNQGADDEPMFKNDYKEDERPFYEQDPMANIFRGDVMSEPLDFSNPNNNYLIDSFDPNRDETNQTPPY